MRTAAAVVLAAALLAPPPAGALDDRVEGACATLGVSHGDRSVATVLLWVAAPSGPGVLATFATCTVTYGAGRTRTFGAAAVGPAAATAVVLEDPAPAVHACATIGALWADGHVVTRHPPCSYTDLEG